MRKILVGALALGLTACADGPEPLPPVEADPVTERTVSGGRIVGFVEKNGAHAWRAIPYAASTAGENRWRAPRPRAPWQGTLDLTEFGPACPQIASAFTQIPGWENGRLEGSEDCLTLDVYAPPDAADRALPVMVWIHGGSNISGASRLYRGDRLAVNEDVIVIAVQYRLGPLGFFSHPELSGTAEMPEDRAANFAVLDLVAALRWVRDNAASFGGDPNLVTIFGESAGGHNVASLLASPLAEGLFHRAIIQSGSFDSVSTAEARGLEGDFENPSLEVGERLGTDRFHTASTAEIFAAYEKDGGGLTLPRMIEDGVTVREGGLRASFLSTETFSDVPVITGTNRDEMKLFYVFNPELTKKVLGTFYTPRDEELYNAASDYSGRHWRVRSVDLPAQAMRAAGHDEVYAYRFDWDEGGRIFWSDTSVLLGAAHGMEIPFVFNRFRIFGAMDSVVFGDETEGTRQDLSRAMGSYWANFARNGEPSAAGHPDWPRYGEEGRLLRFDSSNDGGIEVITGEDSVEALLQDLADDPRVDEKERCSIARSLSNFNGEQVVEPEPVLDCGESAES